MSRNLGKPDLILQELDEWMIRWRRFQTTDDLKIEQTRQNYRQRNYGISLGVFTLATGYTAAPSTINRIFGPPHFFDFGIDVQIKEGLRSLLNSRRRYTPNGLGRILCITSRRSSRWPRWSIKRRRRG